MSIALFNVYSLGGLYYEIQSTPFIADTVGTSSSCPHYRESVIGGVYFCEISVIYFCLGFNFCPYYRGIRKARVDFIDKTFYITLFY